MEDEKKKEFEDVMKKVYGNDRSTEQTPEEKNKELEEKRNDVHEILGKDPKNEVNFVQKEEAPEDAPTETKAEGAGGQSAEHQAQPGNIPRIEKETKENTNKESEIKIENKEIKLELKDPIVSNNPHIRDHINIPIIMWSVILALMPATIAGIYFFKIKALSVILTCIISAVATELVILKLTKKPLIVDGSAVLTGLLLALVLSPAVPLWIPFLGAAFAIAIGKMIFGGLGHNIFNPALVGRAFLVASFPAIMTTWLLPDGTTGATPLGALKLEGIRTTYSKLFLGSIGGCIGETSAIALLIGLALLLFPPLMKHKKPIIDWKIPATYIGTVFILAIIFRQDTLFHLLSGGLFIGAFFMATDYVTAPITKNGRIIFGIGCGALTMIIRLFGAYPEGVMFAILLMNSVSPLIDRFTKPKPFGFIDKKQKAKKEKQKQEEKEIKEKVEKELK